MPSPELPCWIYDKKELKDTPSFRHGIDSTTEARYRYQGAVFIRDTGASLGLHYDTIATGSVYFHRFYMFHSFKDFPRYVTGCCCLFLAGKVEETPKKCNQIIYAARNLLTERQFVQFGTNPKKEMKVMEKILLQTIKFDLHVEHPYCYLLEYTSQLKADSVALQKMVQKAWIFINESFHTTLSLQWESEIIAIALMHLAGKITKFKFTDWHGRTPKHKNWWDLFVEDISLDLIEDICHQVLDVCEIPNPKGATKPQVPPVGLPPPAVKQLPFPPQMQQPNSSNVPFEAYQANPYNPYGNLPYPQTPPGLPAQMEKPKPEHPQKKMRPNPIPVENMPPMVPPPYNYVPNENYAQYTNPPPPVMQGYHGPPPSLQHSYSDSSQFQGNYNSGYQNYQQPSGQQLYYNHNVPPPPVPYQGYQETTYPPGTSAPTLPPGPPGYPPPPRYPASSYSMGQQNSPNVAQGHMQNWGI